MIIEDSIEEITKLLIKEHFEQNDEKYIISKKDLMKFCIQLLKIMKRVDEQ